MSNSRWYKSSCQEVEFGRAWKKDFDFCVDFCCFWCSDRIRYLMTPVCTCEDSRRLSSFFKNDFVYIFTTFCCADDFPTCLQLFGVLILSLSSPSTEISYCQALTASNWTCKQTRHSSPTCQLLGVLLKERERESTNSSGSDDTLKWTINTLHLYLPATYVPLLNWNHIHVFCVSKTFRLGILKYFTVKTFVSQNCRCLQHTK